jgi:hypothetical protein
MNPLRVAILVGFVGATFWVFAPLLNIGSTPPSSPTPAHTSDYDQFLPKRKLGPYDDLIPKRAPAGTYVSPYTSADLERHLQLRDVRSEAVVVTIAGIAWVLAGMVKSKV